MSPAQLARVNELIALCNGSDVNRCGEIIIAAGAPSGVLASAQPSGARMSRDGKAIIALEPLNGVYVVPGVINGVMNVKFLVDTLSHGDEAVVDAENPEGEDDEDTEDDPAGRHEKSS